MAEVADFSYERLAAIRTAARQLLDSGVLFIHERTHVTEIIGRLDGSPAPMVTGDRRAARIRIPERRLSLGR